MKIISKLLHQYKRKLLLILTLFFLSLLIIWVQIFNYPTINRFFSFMDNLVYDLAVRTNAKHPNNNKNNIAIVDIDEKSLTAEGEWPWPRNKIALLAEKIHQLGAVLVAFDVTFTDSQPNIIDSIIKNNPHLSATVTETLKRLQPEYDYDQKLAQAFKIGNVVLGFLFDNVDVPSKGKLPPPLMTLDPKLAAQTIIPAMKSYRSNLPIIQNAAKSSGFTTIIPDEDGIIRRAPLILRYQNKLYPSLGLVIASNYLLSSNISIHFTPIGNTQAVDAIQLGPLTIPTDASGQVIIPFLGPSKHFTYFSATDILNNRIKSSEITNKIIIVGTSALGMSDLQATPLEPTFPGVEIQASIVAAFLKGSFIFKPIWAKGAELLLSLITATLVLILFPLLGAIGIIVLSSAMIGALFLLSFILLNRYQIVLSIFVPFMITFLSTLACLMYGFLFEYRMRQKLKHIFSQYIPASRVEALAENIGTATLAGETKNLTVLFADIINFTHLAEQQNANEIKELLNRFFTPMTEIIFQHNGTIDKYVGDMIMAFWGAPMPDENHAKNALITALLMREKQAELQAEFQKLDLPSINISIGINTGLMHVGDMGSEFRLAYTVLGDAVNLGSRIETLTRTYQTPIIVSETTRAGQTDFCFRLLDRVKVKGRDTPVNIFELIGYENQVDEQLRQELKQHELAMRYYFSQQWEKASSLFHTLKKNNPSTYIYQLFIQRIEQLEKKPPPNWDGTFDREERI